MSDYAQCAVCPAYVKVRQDGKIAMHDQGQSKVLPSRGKRMGEYCNGSGALPKRRCLVCETGGIEAGALHASWCPKRNAVNGKEANND
jgi:hypothetical protein